MHASHQVHMHASPAVHVDATHLSRQQHEQQVVGPREGTLQAPRLSLYVNLVLLLPYLQVGEMARPLVSLVLLRRHLKAGAGLAAMLHHRRCCGMDPG